MQAALFLLLIAIAIAGTSAMVNARSASEFGALTGGRRPAAQPTPATFQNQAQPPPGGKGCLVRLDLVLVLDGSFSIPATEFNTNVKGFASQLVSALTLGPQAVRVGVIQFSSQGTARVETPLSGDARAVLRAISAMTQLQGETDIQEGISLGQSLFDSGGRPLDDAVRVMLVVTDGQDNQPGDLAMTAAGVRGNSTFVFAVGVGPDVDMGQLVSIAGTPDFVFTPADFLGLVGLVDQFALAFCPLPEDHAQLTSPAPYSKLMCGPVTFAWTPGRNAVRYELRVGTSFGASDLFVYRGTDLSAVVSNPPNTGVPLFVDLITVYAATSQANSSVFAACTPACPVCPSGPGLAMQEQPPARCGDRSESGGVGITTRMYDLGTNRGTFKLEYDTFSIPDQIDVLYEGRVIFTTGGPVGESREVDIMLPAGGSSMSITVVVTGMDNSTQWNYTVHCPAMTSMALPSETPRPPPLQAYALWGGACPMDYDEMHPT